LTKPYYKEDINNNLLIYKINWWKKLCPLLGEKKDTI